MPLKNKIPELWHWTEVIQWIAFDDDESGPRAINDRRHYYRVTMNRQIPEGYDTRIARAVDELCDVIKRDEIEPLLQKAGGKKSYISISQSGLSNRLESTMHASAKSHKFMYRKPLYWDELDRLWFNRADVLEVWGPDGDKPSERSKAAQARSDQAAPKEPITYSLRLILEKEGRDWFEKQWIGTLRKRIRETTQYKNAVSCHLADTKLNERIEAWLTEKNLTIKSRSTRGKPRRSN